MLPSFTIDDPAQDLASIRDYIRWAVTHFNQADLCYGHGSDNSWDEAVHLVLSVLHLSPDADTNVLDARITQAEKKQVANLIHKRISLRIPVPYLLKTAWFAGLKFYIDERVLIPRSPIAELLQEEFRPWVEPENITHILDLCTGSGCIAISAALTFPHARVDAVDIDNDALMVAKKNVDHYELGNRLSLIASDLFEQLAPQQYDIIVSNPPYVSLAEYQTLAPEYLHEPKGALAAGIQGLDVVKRILNESAAFLKPTGVLIVEVGLTQSILEEAFPNVPFTWLQFEQGGEGVFLLTCPELIECRIYFQ